MTIFTLNHYFRKSSSLSARCHVPPVTVIILHQGNVVPMLKVTQQLFTHPYRIAIIQLNPCKLADQIHWGKREERTDPIFFMTKRTAVSLVFIKCLSRFLVFTYSSIELHKWRRGAVVEFRLQPSSFYITVSDGCACREEGNVANLCEPVQGVKSWNCSSSCLCQCCVYTHPRILWGRIPPQAGWTLSVATRSPEWWSSGSRRRWLQRDRTALKNILNTPIHISAHCTKSHP